MADRVNFRIFLQQASIGKFGWPFPAGTLVEEDLGPPLVGISNWHLDYAWELDEGGKVGIEIVHYKEPGRAYEMFRLLFDKWKEWPRGYPDQNDYEGVSHCAATGAEDKVAWVQGNVLVILSSLEGASEELSEYAEGVYNAVCKALE